MKGSELIKFIQKKNLLNKEFKVYKEGFVCDEEFLLEEDSFAIVDTEVIIVDNEIIII